MQQKKVFRISVYKVGEEEEIMDNIFLCDNCTEEFHTEEEQKGNFIVPYDRDYGYCDSCQ